MITKRVIFAVLFVVIAIGCGQIKTKNKDNETGDKSAEIAKQEESKNDEAPSEDNQNTPVKLININDFKGIWQSPCLPVNNKTELHLPDVEIFYNHPEVCKKGTRTVTDWIRESIQNEEPHCIWDLDKAKAYQILGKGTLKGWFDYWGEYDEEMKLNATSITEVDLEWLGYTDDVG